MSIKSDYEKTEYSILSEYAVKSAESKGREYDIDVCELRTDFQRDRDRILHSQSFRKLKHKTQVFIAPDGDYFRTRLTHTIEVSQIARTVSRALRLNEDLTEAIAMGHDLGHTPFGHIGERALRHCAGHFEHNEQSLRIVECLENGKGLNLTFEVRDGILNHKRGMTPSTLEGMVVNYSDRIAYLNHDIDDACRAGILKPEDIPDELSLLLGSTHGERIDTMIEDMVSYSMGRNYVGFSREISEATNALRAFLFEHVYASQLFAEEEPKIMNGIEMLYEHCMTDDSFAAAHAESVERYGREQTAVDYIAGMSDRYAINKFKEVFLPKTWM